MLNYLKVDNENMKVAEYYPSAKKQIFKDLFDSFLFKGVPTLSSNGNFVAVSRDESGT